MTAARTPGRAAPWAAWLGSRVLLLFLGPALDRVPGALDRHVVHDVKVYSGWSLTLLDGRFPLDERWQYPPLAAPFIAAPRLLSALTYLEAFVLLAFLADLLVFVLLLYRGRHPAGAWAWTAGLLLLGPVVHFRYDLFVTGCAVAALLALPAFRIFGVLAGLGAMLKAWPLLLLGALPRDRRGVLAVGACAVTGVAVLAGGALFGAGQLGFLSGQAQRGLEIEAVAVTPWQVGRLLGLPTRIVHEFGCAQFAFAAAPVVAAGCQLLTVAGLGWIAYLAWRRDPGGWTPAAGCDTALAAVLVSVVTSRVLSPQYLIWLVGLGAASMAVSGARGRPAVWLVLAGAALTQVVFPVGWQGLLPAEPETAPVLALVLRNVLLLAAAVLAVARLSPAGARVRPVVRLGRGAGAPGTVGAVD